MGGSVGSVRGFDGGSYQSGQKYDAGASLAIELVNWSASRELKENPHRDQVRTTIQRQKLDRRSLAHVRKLNQSCCACFW
jgi:hypothetical protein